MGFTLQAGGLAALAAGLLSILSAPALAADAAAAAGEVEPVYVWGLRKDDIGQAISASQGEVSFAQFADRPLLRPGELAEVVPGLAATQHSGSGKANQYFLRGFNLDHGTDFSVELDGVPLNLPTHGHGQGYLDLNGVIPEVIESIDYRKGPYYADVGDFSAAGGARFHSFDQAPDSYVEATTGSYGYDRLLGLKGLGATGWIALDLEAYRGPWDTLEDTRKFDLMGRLNLGQWSITGLAYRNRWTATDQVPERAIQEGLISRLGAIDPSDGGRTSRLLLSAHRRDWDGWDLDLFVQRYTLQLWNDFTYFLDDPIHGDQFSQVDRRWTYGGSAVRTWPQTALGFALRSGAQMRFDDIGKLGLYKTEDRQLLSTVREDSVGEFSGALWTEAARAFGPLRLTAGFRLDAIAAAVRSDDPRNSGQADGALLSPKLAAAWRLSPALEAYADFGRGFHSNDARGATLSVTPGTNDPAQAVDLFAPATGAEAGLRYRRGSFTATATLWTLQLDSELVYQGDDGDTATSGATRRTGLEVLATWRPASRIELSLSGATTEARYLGHPADGDRIPNAVECVVTAGVSARLTDRAVVALTLRTLGPAPLTQDGLERSQATTLVNAMVDYDLGPARLKLEALNLLDSHGDDIRYFYTSRLPGEPASGVAGAQVHPLEPRGLRISLRVPLM